MEIKFKETMLALNEYFTELKDLRNAGLDLIKFDAHKSLYNIVVKNLIETFGFDEAGVMVQNAYEGKISDAELNHLYKIVCPTETEISGPEPDSEVKESEENAPMYFVDDKPVSKEEYEEALKDVERVFASFSHDWLLRNILG